MGGSARGTAVERETKRGGAVPAADIVYRGGPLLRELDQSATFAAGLALVITAIFLVGLIERRNKTVLSMGIDSLAVLIAYGIGLAGLYTLR